MFVASYHLCPNYRVRWEESLSAVTTLVPPIPMATASCTLKTAMWFIGDLVFNRRFPYIDKGAGASIQGWISVHDAPLRYLDDTTQIICGHAGQGC
ncbi:MAG: hypothetical protein IPH36_19630 [Saprospiraceae bacterium]|nr:hypothetical protein [Saprospiraceae bacterium]